MQSKRPVHGQTLKFALLQDLEQQSSVDAATATSTAAAAASGRQPWLAAPLSGPPVTPTPPAACTLTATPATTPAALSHSYGKLGIQPE